MKMVLSLRKKFSMQSCSCDIEVDEQTFMQVARHVFVCSPRKVLGLDMSQFALERQITLVLVAQQRQPDKLQTTVSLKV